MGRSGVVYCEDERRVAVVCIGLFYWLVGEYGGGKSLLTPA